MNIYFIFKNNFFYVVESFVADDAKLTGTSLGFETSLIIAIAIPAVLILLAVIVVCLVMRRKKYRRYQQSAGIFCISVY